MENRIFRPVVSVPGLEVTRDAEFRYRGRQKKATYYFTVAGRKATVRISIMINGKSHYWQAAKLVAEAWKLNFSSECYLTYRDGKLLMFSTNLDDEHLKMKYGDRVVDRLHAIVRKVTINGKSNRK